MNKPTTGPAINTTSLRFREGNSDKVYHTSIEPRGEGYIVTFAYGRRGNTLTTGTKTQTPVGLDAARKIHAKLVASKLAKGYRHSDPSGSGETAEPYQQTGEEGRDTGIRCQLLNPVGDDGLAALLNDSRHCLQEKHDGRRLLVRRRGGEVTGINRRGLLVALPGPIAGAARGIVVDFLIDGEAVGDTLHAFDLLEVKGHDVRDRGYQSRFAGLLNLLDPEGAIRPVTTVIDSADKRETFNTLLQTGAEGVVFKHLDAAFQPGRPASGGSQLKYKFVETASFIVAGVNGGKSSVALEIIARNGDRVPAGNVTIPPNHEVPERGSVCEVRYLYAHRESGSIYQPVYLGLRDDIPAEECTTGQLKYKPEPVAA